MSRHHRAQKWSTHSPKLRKLIEPQLPLPCVECRRPVMPGAKFDVAHIQGAEHGGAPALGNVGPAHPQCNRSAGGKRGAQITNQGRRAATNRSKGIRNW
ncbi:hypothetical protein JOF28_001958 [Leucobacter exalbidus]|uniref:HNH domain-containing protein n=1 Tax=Leucobacter exalbidus TaxID=662960 RepID=A0A940PZ03_9MICO|nr:HNH endonuclease [Leucobacter exalbidus]MBP1326726.1 hypothetical protein [Leucobacter exalbidus]